jgi:CHAP domain
MLDTRAFLFVAAAIGLASPQARALPPLAIDLSLDPVAGAAPVDPAAPALEAGEPEPEPVFESVARISDPAAGLQCVPFARAASGVEIYGDASTWWDQARDRYQRADAPEEGAVLVMRGHEDAERGHVALVRERVSPRLIVVDHANWLNQGEISSDVPVRDVSEAGDWSQVQVWNPEAGHWGARVYPVQGFILNQPAVQQAGGAVPLG